jgi:hypothetical protein
MEQVVEKLDDINKTLTGILQSLNKPENKVMAGFKLAGAVVSALGILGIIEIVRRWLTGG